MHRCTINSSSSSRHLLLRHFLRRSFCNKNGPSSAAAAASTLSTRIGSSRSSSSLLLLPTATTRDSDWRSRSKSTLSSPIAAFDQSVDVFPSLIVGAGRALEPVGTFAEAQAMYLEPDATAVADLKDALIRTNTGIVAHYYMDVELQGVLQAVGRELPGRIGVADSLKMGDLAVEFASGSSNDNDDDTAGVANIACLGVDFMSESVNAILNKNGFEHVPVYRAAQAQIGCSLAESAERESYRAWLRKESEGRNALHVVYINTSLETKATSGSIVPTITCTSSNVLATLLQASAQMGDDDLKILYGPDTYMGENLETLLSVILGEGTGSGSGWDDDRIARELHPEHDRTTLARLRDSISVFPSGNCVVHHMFGRSVVDAVKRNYDDAYVTAHLEVPGEMFEIAMQKSLTDDGVVGSTSNILQFISRKVEEAAAATAGASSSGSSEKKRLRFILGTEAGMVTSIVQSVRDILERTGNSSVEAEIVFPVAQDAVMGTVDDGGDNDSSELSIVPGVGGGEGCSTAGGCATCPFMKMNDLDALMDVLELIAQGDTAQLAGHLPPDRLSGRTIEGRPALDLGTEPIVYMRHLMQEKRLPDELVQKVLRGGGSATR